jgi:hypothetical protein
MKIKFMVFILFILNVGTINGQGCIGRLEWQLAKGINDFRQTNNKPPVNISLMICKQALMKAKNLAGENHPMDLPPDFYNTSEKFI